MLAVSPSPRPSARTRGEGVQRPKFGVDDMQKWNMIIDVAECTNCNLCTLSAMDEYVGNDFPGYAAPMPKHGHKWINILQKERGQVPMIDIAYVPTMCNHCDDAALSGEGRRRDEEARRRHRAHRSRSGPRAARTWSRPVRTATSGGTRNCSCRKSGRSTPISSIRAGSRPAVSRRARPARCGDQGRGRRDGAHRRARRVSR